MTGPRRILAAIAAALAIAAAAVADDLLLRHARLLDGTGAPPRPDVSILIHDGRIAAVGADGAPGDVRAVDLDGATVLPGLMDVHVHFVAAPGGVYRHDTPAALHALNARHLRAYLACGVTTVLDAGIDVATARGLQQWLAAGHPGPRFLTTGPYVRPPGGYGWDGFGAERTPADVEAKLDRLRDLGAVGVKLAFEPTSGFDGEMRRAIVDGAARRRLPLFIHATTEAAQTEALDWGARAIMHPVLGGRWQGALREPADLSDAFVANMRARGAYQATTLSLLDTWPGRFDVGRLDDPLVRLTVPAVERATAADPRARRAFADGVVGFAMPWIPHVVRPLALDWVWTRANLDAELAYSQRNLRRLHEAGVPLAIGTDAPSPWPWALYHFHGVQTLRELELVADAGIPPAAVLVAATRRPAEMLGLGAELGTVEPGKRADLVVVRGDPLGDVRAMRNVVLTIHDGVAHTPAEWMAIDDAPPPAPPG